MHLEAADAELESEALAVRGFNATEEHWLSALAVLDHLERLLATISGEMSGLPADKAGPLGLVLLARLAAVPGHVALLAAIHTRHFFDVSRREPRRNAGSSEAATSLSRTL